MESNHDNQRNLRENTAPRGEEERATHQMDRDRELVRGRLSSWNMPWTRCQKRNVQHGKNGQKRVIVLGNCVERNMEWNGD